MKINELKAAIYAKGGKPGKFKNKHELIQKFLKLLLIINIILSYNYI